MTGGVRSRSSGPSRHSAERSVGGDRSARPNLRERWCRSRQRRGKPPPLQTCRGSPVTARSRRSGVCSLTRRVAGHSVSDAGSEDRVAGSCESTKRSRGTGPRSRWGTTRAKGRREPDPRSRGRGDRRTPEEGAHRRESAPDRGWRWIDSRRLPREAVSAESSVRAIGKPIAQRSARRQEHERPGPAGAHGRKTSVAQRAPPGRSGRAP